MATIKGLDSCGGHSLRSRRGWMRAWPAPLGVMLKLAPALLGLCAGPVLAASFPCETASTAQEKAICASPPLSMLDEQLASAYQSVEQQLSPEGAAKLKDDQAAWLHWLDARCPFKEDKRLTLCLREEYDIRVRGLRRGTVQVGGMLFFPRLKVLTVSTAQPPGTRRFRHNPGFGIGRFSWPEIDRPTPSQAQWNAAVHAQAVALSQGGPTPAQSPDDFSPAAATDSDVRQTYRVEAANDRLIAVTLMNEGFVYGAAHPHDSHQSFLWLPDKQRPLAVEDVFRPGSGWEKLLARGSYEQSREQMRSKTGVLDDSPQAEKRVDREALRVVQSPANWSPDPAQLKIVFPEYTLTPRAFGMLTTVFPWEQLKPFLADGFDPALLPAPYTP